MASAEVGRGVSAIFYGATEVGSLTEVAEVGQGCQVQLTRLWRKNQKTSQMKVHLTKVFGLHSVFVSVFLVIWISWFPPFK